MSYIPLPTDINNNVLTALAPSQTDIVGTIVTGERTNTVVASFSHDTGVSITDLINISATGTGGATMNAGSGIFSSGSGTTSSVTGVTFTDVKYNPSFEIYVTFSVSYTTPTSANSSQFIGLWDVTNDGFYIGYNGTTFGIASMFNGTQTFVARSSWNTDLLDGSATSKFTRNGVPEAINLTYLNLFRIRFSWWGSAPILYEVMTPDGQWIVFHTIRQPNTSVNPSLTSPNLPVTLKITKSSADSTDLIMKCGSWAAGTTSPMQPDIIDFAETSWVSSTTVDSVITTSTLGAGSIALGCAVVGTITSGTIVFEATTEGTVWFALSMAPIAGSIGPAAITSYNLINGSFLTQANTSGFLKVRARLTSAIVGSGSVSVSLRPSAASVSRMVQVYQPTGSNLRAVIDSGSISVTNSSTANSPSAVSVGITSTSVLPSNASRKGLVLTNTSNRVISLGLNNAAPVLNSGITLQPGGIWVMDPNTFTTGAINAIASGAASNLAIQEFQ